MRRYSRAAVGLIVLLLLLSACASSRRTQDGPIVGDRSGPATLVVDNQSWADMRIYVVAGGQRIRLGNVTGSRTSTLPIPDHVVAGGRELTFQADPVAGREVANSFSIYVWPGDRVRLMIPATVR